MNDQPQFDHSRIDSVEGLARGRLHDVRSVLRERGLVLCFWNALLISLIASRLVSTLTQPATSTTATRASLAQMQLSLAPHGFFAFLDFFHLVRDDLVRLSPLGRLEQMARSCRARPSRCSNPAAPRFHTRYRRDCCSSLPWTYAPSFSIALVSPALAAFSYHSRAVAGSRSTPRPSAYASPSLACARGFPASARGFSSLIASALRSRRSSPRPRRAARRRSRRGCFCSEGGGTSFGGTIEAASFGDSFAAGGKAAAGPVPLSAGARHGGCFLRHRGRAPARLSFFDGTGGGGFGDGLPEGSSRPVACCSHSGLATASTSGGVCSWSGAGLRRLGCGRRAAVSEAVAWTLSGFPVAPFNVMAM